MTKKKSFIIVTLLITVILGIGVGVVAKQAIDKKNQELFGIFL